MNSRGENPSQGQWYCQPAQLDLEDDVQMWPKGSKDTSSIYCSVGSNAFGNVFSLNYLRIETCELCNICVYQNGIFCCLM